MTMTTLETHRAFLADALSRQSARRQIIDPTYPYTPLPEIWGHGPVAADAEAGPSKRNIPNYVPEEETIRNDLTERYIESGEFGSNYILGAEESEICEEYPALRKLMDLKTEHVTQNSHPPIHLPLADSSATTISSAITPTRFDVILLRPAGTWEETAELPIRNLSADPSFVFLWVGKGDDEGLEKGRECFAKWGFRRAEDIVWVKTNKRHPKGEGDGLVEGEPEGKGNEKGKSGQGTGGGGLFASSKEHCLMGIRGTVRRSTDTRFVHCNVDTDILVWEQDDPKEIFPPYLYTLIENFCLGTRRLELFGTNARRGWVSATTTTLEGEANLKFDPNTYPSLLPHTEPRPILPFHPEIDQLRPKSPPRRGATRGGHLPHNPHPHPHQPYAHSARPPRHHHNQYQHQQQTHGQMNQMQVHAQAQAQAQMMQMQMQHIQMMAAMNMNTNMGMGMTGQDPMMHMQMQGMGMGMGLGTGVQDPSMNQMGMGVGVGTNSEQGHVQNWAYGQMGSDGGLQGPIPGYGQGWQGGYQQYDSQGQFRAHGGGQGQGQGQWQGGQYFQPGQGQGQGHGQWGWQQ